MDDDWVGKEYADEFEKLVSVMEFFYLMFNNLKGFILNVLEPTRKSKQRPVYEWIEMFLDWMEYTEYKNYKNKDSLRYTSVFSYMPQFIKC